MKITIFPTVFFSVLVNEVIDLLEAVCRRRGRENQSVLVYVPILVHNHHVGSFCFLFLIFLLKIIIGSFVLFLFLLLFLLLLIFFNFIYFHRRLLDDCFCRVHVLDERFEWVIPVLLLLLFSVGHHFDKFKRKLSQISNSNYEERGWFFVTKGCLFKTTSLFFSQ